MPVCTYVRTYIMFTGGAFCGVEEHKGHHRIHPQGTGEGTVGLGPPAGAAPRGTGPQQDLHRGPPAKPEVAAEK